MPMPGNVRITSYGANNSNAPSRTKSLDCLTENKGGDKGDEYVPSRLTRMAPKANEAAMQFVKTGPANLYKSATEQIKKSEAVKAMRKHLIEEEEEWQQPSSSSSSKSPYDEDTDWQSNLDKWKSSRRKRNEEALERVIEIKKNEQEEEFGRTRRKSKTFSEMREDKTKRGRRYNLVVHDDDNNDLGDLGLNSAKSTTSLNDPQEDTDVKDIDQDNKDAKSDAGFCTGSDTGSDGVFAEDNISDTSSALGDKKEAHDSLLDSGLAKEDEPHINGHGISLTTDILQVNSSIISSDEYTYDKAIEGYKQYAENSAKKRTSSITSLNSNTSYTKDEERKEEKSKMNDNRSPSPSKSSKLEEKLSFFSKEMENQFRTSPEPKVVLREKSPKVDIGKRRSMFEVNESVTVQSTKEQKQVHRRSLDFSNSLRNKVASFENLEMEAPRARSITPNRDTSLRSKVASFENLDCHTSKVRGITPPRDMKFHEKLATFTSPDSELQPVTKKTPERDMKFHEKLATFTSPDSELQPVTKKTPERDMKFQEKLATFTSPDSELQPVTKKTPERDVNFHKKLASFTSIENGDEDKVRERKTVPTRDPMLKNKIASFEQLEQAAEVPKPAPVEITPKSRERSVSLDNLDEPQLKEVMRPAVSVGNVTPLTRMPSTTIMVVNLEGSGVEEVCLRKAKTVLNAEQESASARDPAKRSTVYETVDKCQIIRDVDSAPMYSIFQYLSPEVNAQVFELASKLEETPLLGSPTHTAPSLPLPVPPTQDEDSLEASKPYTDDDINEVISDYEQVGTSYEDVSDHGENIYENITDEPMYENIYEKVNDEDSPQNELVSDPHYQTIEEVRATAPAEEVELPSSPVPPPTVPVPQQLAEPPVVEAPEVLDVTWTDGPSQAAPPSEPPPPPPPDDDSDEDASDQLQSLPAQEEKEDELKDAAFTRENSTRRIKKELWRRRSDFLGTSSQFIEEEPAVKPPPDLSDFLRKEREVDRVLLESHHSKISTTNEVLNEEEINRREREIIENLERAEKLRKEQQQNKYVRDDQMQHDVATEDTSEADEHLQYQMCLNVNNDCDLQEFHSVPPPPPSPVFNHTFPPAYTGTCMPSPNEFLKESRLGSFEEASDCFVHDGVVCCSPSSNDNSEYHVSYFDAPSPCNVSLPYLPEFDDTANCSVRHGGVCGCSSPPVNLSVPECGVPSLTPIPECEESSTPHSASPETDVSGNFVGRTPYVSHAALSPILESSHTTTPETITSSESPWITSPEVVLTPSTDEHRGIPDTPSQSTSLNYMIENDVKSLVTEDTCQVFSSQSSSRNSCNHNYLSHKDQKTPSSMSSTILECSLNSPQQGIQSNDEIPASTPQSLGESLGEAVPLPHPSDSPFKPFPQTDNANTSKVSRPQVESRVPDTSRIPVNENHTMHACISSTQSETTSHKALSSQSLLETSNTPAQSLHSPNENCNRSSFVVDGSTNMYLCNVTLKESSTEFTNVGIQLNRIEGQPKSANVAPVKKSNKVKMVRFNIASDSSRDEESDSESSYDLSSTVDSKPDGLNPQNSLLANTFFTAEKQVANNHTHTLSAEITSSTLSPSQAENQQTSSESNKDTEVAMMVPEASPNTPESSHSVSETTDKEPESVEFDHLESNNPQTTFSSSLKSTVNTEETQAEVLEEFVVEAQTGVVEVATGFAQYETDSQSRAEAECELVSESSDPPGHLVAHYSQLDYSSDSVASTSSLPDQYKKLAELEEEMMRHDKDMLQRAGKLPGTPADSGSQSGHIPPPSLYSGQEDSSPNITSEDASYSFQPQTPGHLPIQEFYTAPSFGSAQSTSPTNDSVVNPPPGQMLVTPPSSSPSQYSTLASPHPFNRSHSQSSINGSPIHPPLQGVKSSPMANQDPVPEPLPRKKKLPPPPPNKPQASELNTAERMEAIRLSRMPTSDASINSPDATEIQDPSASPSGQQMSKQTLLALSAIPKPRLTDNESWITKKKPETRRDYSKHWLHQEAEQRRLEQQERISRYKPAATPPQMPTTQTTATATPPQQRSPPHTSNVHQNTFIPQNTTPTYSSYPQALKNPSLSHVNSSSNTNNINNVNNNTNNSNNNSWRNQATTYQPPMPAPTPTGDKALPDSIIHNLTQRVNNKNHKNTYNNNNGRLSNTYGNNSYRDENYHDYMNADALSSPSSHAPLYQSATGMGHPSPPSAQQDSPSAQDHRLSVSGKKKCSHCSEELGRGAAMIIESLRLFYHIPCFKCCVCGIQLGNGSAGADVRVRNHKLHCHNCYSNDEGTKFSKV